MAGQVEYENKRIRLAYKLLDAAAVLTTGTEMYKPIFEARQEMEVSVNRFDVRNHFTKQEYSDLMRLGGLE